MRKTIALLGQPNSGKSTVFNGLTGARQHVGNWPGKTVEHKEGRFYYQGTEYDMIDLPGSYSLSAGSEEEKITADFIGSGKADLVAILVDSSQLERSLYMYADYIGNNTPVMLILNMMDVAEKKGMCINISKLGERMGIPVLGFVASDTKQYGALKKQLAEAVDAAKMADVLELMKYYSQDAAITVNKISDIRELEKTTEGLMISGKHKYEYVDWLLDGVVS